MTEHTVFLNDIEAAAPDLRLIVRPFPRAIMRYPNGAVEIANAVYPARESGYIVWYGKDAPGLAEFTKQQYKDGFANPLGVPGDVLLGKEAMWYPTCLNCGTLKYVADHVAHPGYMYERIPSSRMPRDLIRWRRPVVEVGVMRVGEITTEQAVMAGFQDTQGRPWWPRTEFRKSWNRRWKQAGNPWCEPGSWAWFAWVGKEEENA